MKIKLFIDCQNDFFDGTMKCEGADKELDDRLKKAFKESIKDSDYVIITLDTHHRSKNNYIESSTFPEHCINLSKGWELIPGIKDTLEELSDKEVEKIFATQKKTFGSIELIAIARSLIQTEENVEIELCGLLTDLSLLHNSIILYNTVPNAKFIIDSTCCAGTTLEKHENALNILKNLGFVVK